MSLKILNPIKILLFTILLCTTSILCFYNLSKPPLALWDEYTNFNVVCDTLDSDNTLILKKSDNYFFEKPPLWYYLTMFSAKIFGLNNFSIRFISAVSGFFLIMLIFYLGWKMFSYNAGIIAAFSTLAARHLFLANPYIFSTHSLRSADLDALLLLFIILSALGFYNFIKLKNKYFWLITAAIFSGFGFLTKGPFALIPAIAFFTFQLINHKKVSFKKIIKQFLIFNFTFLILVLPWHIYMYAKFRNEFLDNYFFYHVLNRGISALEGHNEGIFFYIRLLFRRDFFFSGEIFLLAVIYLISKYKSLIIKDFKLFFCFTASLLVILIISTVQTKLSWYIFPFYPFAALIIGKFFNDLPLIRVKWIEVLIILIIIITIILQIVSALTSI